MNKRVRNAFYEEWLINGGYKSADLEDRGSMQPSELIASKLASMSCKAAIKGGQKISFKEADALVSQLLTLENPYACPHGRPTIITMTKYELEKKFKRIV